MDSRLQAELKESWLRRKLEGPDGDYWFVAYTPMVTATHISYVEMLNINNPKH